jgi:integrase
VLTLEGTSSTSGKAYCDWTPRTTRRTTAGWVYLTPGAARADALQKRLGRIIPFLFPHMQGTQRAGQRRQDYRKAWATACCKAGVPGMLRHGIRGSAVRNMVTRDGVPDRVAMQITGHKTPRVFDIYHIVRPGDLQEAARKMAGRVAVGERAAGHGDK